MIRDLKEIIKTNMNAVFYPEMLFALNELENYKNLEAQGKLIIFPCKVGDYIQFPYGKPTPVIYITSCNDGDINIGCQNGTIISMNNNFKCWGVKFITKEDFECK